VYLGLLKKLSAHNVTVYYDDAIYPDKFFENQHELADFVAKEIEDLLGPNSRFHLGERDSQVCLVYSKYMFKLLIMV